MRSAAIAALVAGCTFHTDPTIDPPADSGVDGTIDAPADAPPTIAFLTETANGNVTPGDAVYCGAGGSNDDAWYRAFRPGDFGITGTLHILAVHFTAETAKSANAITVTIWTYTGTIGAPALDLTKMTPLTTVTGSIPDAGGPTDVWVTRRGDVAPGGAFVVGISSTNSASSWFHLGANAAAETEPSYYASAACGMTTPTSRPGHSLIIDTEGSW